MGIASPIILASRVPCFSVLKIILPESEKRRKTNYKIIECSHEFSHTEVYDQDSDSVQVLQCFDHVNQISCAVLTRSLLHDWVMWFAYMCLTWSIRRLRLPKECFLFF